MIWLCWIRLIEEPEIAMALLHYCSCSSPSSPTPLLPFKKWTPKSIIFTVPALRPFRHRFSQNRPSPRLSATLAVESPTTSGDERGGDSPKILLEVKGLSAVISESKQPILKGVNLVIKEGEVSDLILYIYVYAHTYTICEFILKILS